MMFSYISIGTNDLARAVVFYDAVMAVLGHKRIDLENDQSATWGLDDPGPHLWVSVPFDDKPATVGNGSMFSLLAATRPEVDAVHATALRHGGTSEGAPGLRPHYGPHFYAAYMRDPDGNKFNTVCYAPAG